MKTSMVPGTNLSIFMALVLTEDKEYIKKVPYISAVSSLLFLALPCNHNIDVLPNILAVKKNRPAYKTMVPIYNKRLWPRSILA